MAAFCAFPVILFGHPVPPRLEEALGLSHVSYELFIEFGVVRRDDFGQFVQSVTPFEEATDFVSLLGGDVTDEFLYHFSLMSKGSE